MDLKQQTSAWFEQIKLPAAAKAVQRADASGLPSGDPGPARVVEVGLAWLSYAQIVREHVMGVSRGIIA